MKILLTTKSNHFNKHIYAIRNDNQKLKQIRATHVETGIQYDVVPMFECIEQTKYHQTLENEEIVSMVFKSSPFPNNVFLVESIFSDLGDGEMFYIGDLIKHT